MNRRMLGIILIVAGAITLAAGVALVATSEKQKADNELFDASAFDTVGVTQPVRVAESVAASEPRQPESQPLPKAKTPEQKPEPVSSKENTAQFDQNKRKGDDFEKFVVKHFDPKYFNVMEWRGDKYVDGRYAVSNHFPDLEIEFFYKKEKVNERFAVECKWRKDYYKNGVQWAENYNIRNYQDYAREVKVPVFVAIGVGGTPDNPETVYILPLKKATTPFLTTEELAPFKRRDPKANFFYDYENDWLN